MNLLPAAAAAWLAAQLTQEFEAKQPSLADQIPGYGGGYGPKPGPSHTGNDKPANPISGGTSTTYPAEGPKESGVVGGKPLDPQKPGDNILPGSPADPLPGVGPVFSEENNSSGNLSLGLHKPIEELISDASKPINSGGLSQAARAWDKHDTSRPGGTFPVLTGNTEEKNRKANEWIYGVVTNPETTQTRLPSGAVRYRLPSGQGVIFEADGKVNFVDPRKPFEFK